MTVGERIKAVRKYYNCNQRDFAAMIGLSQAHVSNIEANKDNPSDKLIKHICTVFKIDPDWLKTGNGDMLIHINIENVKFQKSLIELEKNLTLWGTDPSWNYKNAVIDFTSILSLYKPDPNGKLDYSFQTRYYEIISSIISKLLDFVMNDDLIKNNMNQKDIYTVLIHQDRMKGLISQSLDELSKILFKVHGVDIDVPKENE